MTLDELKIRLGAEAAKAIALYGPTVLSMSEDTLRKWIDYVFVGRYIDAYALYLKALPASDLLTEWDKEGAAWKADNKANAEKIAMSNQIALAVCKVMLAIVLVVVGL